MTTLTFPLGATSVAVTGDDILVRVAYNYRKNAKLIQALNVDNKKCVVEVMPKLSLMDIFRQNTTYILSYGFMLMLLVLTTYMAVASAVGYLSAILVVLLIVISAGYTTLLITRLKNASEPTHNGGIKYRPTV